LSEAFADTVDEKGEEKDEEENEEDKGRMRCSGNNVDKCSNMSVHLRGLVAKERQ